MSFLYLLSRFISTIVSSTFLQKSSVRLSSYRRPSRSSSSLMRSFISLRSAAHSGTTNFGSFFFFFLGRRLAGSVGFLVSGSRGFLVLKSMTNGSGYGSGLCGQSRNIWQRSCTLMLLFIFSLISPATSRYSVETLLVQASEYISSSLPTPSLVAEEVSMLSISNLRFLSAFSLSMVVLAASITWFSMLRCWASEFHRQYP